MNDNRPDPDALLEAIQKQEARLTRGKLKIFFGMAAGVGKTYTMLSGARQRQDEGVDVVIGYVETHKRVETDALVTGLEIVPRQQVEYRGSTLEEMDLDAILMRRPALVLVDELAHSNAPGVRHTKRWQDVLELLEAGIDVYTTVNVQHFESRADAVRQITGIIVQETVPDSILDVADEIELVDLSPADLRKRLAEGKVYTADKADKAAANFFRVGNLTALREMALRLTAEYVDHKLQDYMQIKRIAGPWKSSERLMVAVGPSPFSEQLIRWTRRIAYNLEAPWIGVYIETSTPLAAKSKDNLARNLALVRDLGGEVITIAGDDITETLLRLARQRNVSQIVIGKPQRHSVREILNGGSLVDKIIRASGDIDIYVVTGDTAEPQASSRLVIASPQTHSNWHQYLLALGIVASITIFDYFILDIIGYQAIGLTELLAVLLIAVYIGRGPALVAAAASAVSWNFLFINPRFTFEITQVQDIFLFVMYFAIAIFAGNLTARIRTQERQARYNFDRTMALYNLAHEIATAVTMEDVLRMAMVQIERVFNADVAIILTEANTLSRQAHSSSSLIFDEKEYGAALWSFEHHKSAGRYTNTLPTANAQYFPLRTLNRSVGIIGIHTRANERLSFDEEALLETFVNQIALVIEREMLDQDAEQAAMLQESERLYTTLLNSISHELRTPIATITGAATTLLDEQTPVLGDEQRELFKTIESGADRLNRLVENLLDMSRLESGRLNIKTDWCDVRELIAVAVKRLEPELSKRHLQMLTAQDLPLLRLDFVLVEQVLVNLLDNACHYTPEGATITIDAYAEDRSVVIEIVDNGEGIPEGDLERIFEKFYRLPGTAAGGTGLGLSISRGLIEAHGGTLVARNAPDGGARFIVSLPMSKNQPVAQEATL